MLRTGIAEAHLGFASNFKRTRAQVKHLEHTADAADSLLQLSEQRCPAMITRSPLLQGAESGQATAALFGPELRSQHADTA